MGFSNQIIDMLIAKAKADRRPITVNFELLPVCNLDCKMCYVRSEWSEVELLGGLKSPEEWLRLAEEMKDAGSLLLLLTGGEPFIYPGFKELYIELYKMGFLITINTNGTMIDEGIVEWLSKYPPKTVSISLYGSSDEAYERLCGRKNMFSKVNHAIELLQQAGIYVELKTILNPLNAEELEACYEYTLKKNIPYEASPYSFMPTRRCDEKEIIRFDAREVADQMIRINRVMASSEQFDEDIIKYLKKYEDTKQIEGRDCYGFKCSATNSSCWITWQGKMTPCGMLDFPATEPLKEGFLNAWENLKRKSDDILISRTCSHCDKRNICTVCPGAAYGETGDIGGTSRFHCEMTDKLLDEMNKHITEKEIGSVKI